MVPESLLLAMQLLRGVRRKGPMGTLARDVLALLERADEELRAEGTVVRRESGRSAAAIEYVVEMTKGVEVVTESRLSGKSAPFKCPKAIYDAMVQVLAAAERPMSLEDIMEAVNRHVTDAAAEYQVRVPLRLWMHVDPALIVRSRARYRLADPKAFISQATRLWSSLRTS
jgi:hypothetical protein